MTRLAAIIAAAAMLVAASIGAHAAPLSSLSVCMDGHYPPQTLDVSRRINLGQLKKQVAAYVCSGTYDSDLNKVTAGARAYIEQRAAHVDKPALVLDIDETSLSNLPLELADDFAYIKNISCALNPKSKPKDPKLKAPCGFNDWVALGRAPVIDGTLDLYDEAMANHVAVFFITGRGENERTATEENLKEAGYKDWKGLVLRPANDNRTTIEYKSAAREKIAEAGYTIIVNAGDQQSDLAGGFAERAYKLPNPMYFIP